MINRAAEIAEYLHREIVPLIPHVDLPVGMTPEMFLAVAIEEHFGPVPLEVIGHACAIVTELMAADKGFNEGQE